MMICILAVATPSVHSLHAATGESDPIADILPQRIKPDLGKASAPILQAEIANIDRNIQKLEEALDRWRYVVRMLQDLQSELEKDKQQKLAKLQEVAKRVSAAGNAPQNIESIVSEMESAANINISRYMRAFITSPVFRSTTASIDISLEKDKIINSIQQISDTEANKTFNEKCGISELFNEPIKAENYPECKSAFERIVEQKSLETALASISREISVLLESNRRRTAAIDNRMKELQGDKAELYAKLQKATSLNDDLLTLAAPGLGVIVILLLIAPRLYETTIQQSVFDNDVIIQLLTVFLLTTTILVLGIADKIPQDSLGTLLGGISGYVLGRSINRRQQNAGASQPAAPPLPAPAPAPPP